MRAEFDGQGRVASSFRDTERVNAEVQAPDGRRWRVSRRTLLWRPRRRMRFDVDVIGFALGLIALPLLALEWILALLLSVAAGGLRTAFGRPWRVDAVLAGATERRLTWNASGWREAGRIAEQVRAEIAAGQDPSTHANQRALTAGG